jgi:hypothetical protein
MRAALVGLVVAAGACGLVAPRAVALGAEPAPGPDPTSAVALGPGFDPSALHAASAMAVDPASARALDPSALDRGSIPAVNPALDPTSQPCGLAGATATPTAGECVWGISPGKLLTAGKQLVTGNPGGAVRTVVGGVVKTAVGDAAGTLVSTATTAIGLAAIGVWVVGGAQGVLHDTASALGATTSPQLRSTWFSATYWRMAAIAAVLTLPFLFAAAVQALIRSDLGLLLRAAFGYLPLAMLAIAIVAPLTMLLLAASDQMSSWISSAAGNASSDFLTRAGDAVIGLTALSGSPFLAFLIGLFLIGAAFALWVELLLREAAVYVIVLMLPLAFAALVWPTRRIWAIRAVEVLAALILSKFAIVAVLSLGGAALDAGTGHGGIAQLMAGAVLILLAAFSPWALLRLVPMAEVAAGVAGPLRGELRPGKEAMDESIGRAIGAEDALTRLAARMRDDGGTAAGDAPAPPQPAPPQPAPPQPAPPQPAPPRPAPTPRPAPHPGPTPPRADARPESEAPPEDEPEDQSPAANEPEQPFSRRRALELGGPNHGVTPVRPHPDAE